MPNGTVFAAHLMFLYSTAFIANYLRISVNVVGRHLFSLTQSSEGPNGIDIVRAMLPTSGILGLLNGSSVDPERKFEEPGLLELSPHIRNKCLGSSEHFLHTGLPILADIVMQACIGTMEKCVFLSKIPFSVLSPHLLPSVIEWKILNACPLIEF